MSTIRDIGEEIAVELLKRTDMMDVCTKQVRNSYILVCTKVPFDNLQVTSAERAVDTTNSEYTLSDLDPALAGIVSIRMTYAGGRVRRLRRSHVRAFEFLPYSVRGEPARYCRWGTGIQFDRVPNSASYTYRVRYWSRPNLDADYAETTIITPPEWDELYKWLALYRVYYHLGETEKAMSLVTPAVMPRQMSPKKTTIVETGIIPMLWNDLLTTISQKENIDENFSVNPIVRPYN